jgi:hypothetical protein
MSDPDAPKWEKTPEDATLKVAPTQLLVWAAAERSPNFATQLGAAINAARSEWPWAKVAGFAARLITTEGSDPEDLTIASRKPTLKAQPVADPEDTSARGAAKARQMIAENAPATAAALARHDLGRAS